MPSPCESCRSGPNLNTLGSEMLDLVGVLENGTTETWDEVSAMTAFMAEVEDITPGQRAQMEQSTEFAARVTARMVRLSGEAIDLVRGTLTDADEIDCQASGTDLKKSCPKIEAILAIQPTLNEILSQNPGPDI